MEVHEIEKKLKRKMVELLTMCDIVKELNFSSELDIGKVIETFINSVAGLFLMDRAVFVLLDKDNEFYITGEDAAYKEGISIALSPKIVGICAEMKEKGGALSAEEIKDEEIRGRLKGLGIELIIPMFLRKELKALFLAGRRVNQEAYSEEDSGLIFAFANQAIVSIENARFFKSLQRHVEELTIFNEITAAINSDLDINTLLDMVLGVLIKMLNAFAGFIIIMRENRETLFFIFHGLDEKKIEALLRGKDKDGMISKSLISSTEKLLFFNPEDASSQEKDLFNYDNQARYLWFSRSLFVRKENMIGIVGLCKNIKETLSDEDINLFLTLTSQLITIVLNARLYELSITDGLTNLFVHTYFEQRLREELSRARRYSSSVSVIMMDIDRFKELNDSLGHQMGNVVLKRLASIIKFSVRKNEDIPSRWGGDEFAIILPETGRDGAFVLAERIRRNMENFSFSQEHKERKVSISAGISSFPSDSLEEKDLIEQADTALYQAKKAGGNKVVLFNLSSMDK